MKNPKPKKRARRKPPRKLGMDVLRMTAHGQPRKKLGIGWTALPTERQRRARRYMNELASKKEED